MLSPRMAYVLLWFPLSSETFVFREVQQLVQRGMDIRVYTMYGEKLRGCSDEMKNYAGPIKRFGSVATLRLQKAFGEKGSYLSSAMISFTQIGWFGVGIAMFAIKS